MSRDVEPMDDAELAYHLSEQSGRNGVNHDDLLRIKARLDALQAVVDKLRDDESLLDEVETDFHCGVTRDGRALGGVWETLMMRTDTARRIKERRKAAEAAMKEQRDGD